MQDLARWDRALTGDSVLPAAKRELLFTPNLDDYGYGWVIQKKGAVTYEWHNGALSLANRDLQLVQPLFESKVASLALK